MKQLPKSAVIIGAGIGGLATASILAKAGMEITVVEQRAIAGGRAGLLKKDGFTFDSGPSWYLMPEVFEHFFALLGEDVNSHLDLIKLDPAFKVFFESAEPITIHTDIKRDGATFEAREAGAGKALERYLKSSTHTYDMAVKHFLYTNFDAKRRLLHGDVLKSLPKLGSLLRQPIDKYVDGFVSNPQLKQVLQYPMVFLGVSPYDAPAMYSLMSHMDFNQGVFYPQGGMYTIIEVIERIAKNHGVEFRYGESVANIELKNGSASGVKLSSGEVIEADIVISNADLHFTETVLLPKEASSYPASYWQKRTPSPSALLMYLGVSGELPQLTHHNLLFTEDWKGNFATIKEGKHWPTPASMYVSKPSQTDPSVAPKDHENVFVLVPIAAKTGVADQVERYADLYLDQIADMAGIPDLKQRLVVKELYGPDDFAHDYNSWRGTALGMAHTLRQSALFRPANQSKKVSNLYYVGANSMPGIGLPMCLIGAEILYKRLIGDTSSGPLKMGSL